MKGKERNNYVIMYIQIKGEQPSSARPVRPGRGVLSLYLV